LEISHEERATGGFRNQMPPACFVMKADLAAEVLKLKGDGKNRSDPLALEVIKADRPCDSFFEWRQGFSPKEHLEMDIAERIQRSQDERMEADRRFQAEERARSEKREEDRRTADRKYNEEQKKKDHQLTLEREQAAFRRQIATTLISLVFGALFTAFVKWLLG